MTPAQLAILKADITANFPSVPMTPDGDFSIAAAYNLDAVPDFFVWRTAVTKTEYVQSVSPIATTFNWVGNGFITRSVGEQSAWQELFGSGSANPSLANVRQAFVDIFSGTGNAAANRTHLEAMSKRKALRVEKLFAVGTGSVAVPATMGFEGQVTPAEVNAARNLP